MHENVWREKGYFDNCYVLIHPKYPSNVGESLKKYITSPLINTEWGDRSIVDATLILLFNAYSQSNSEWFILCAEDSYPLKEYLYVEKDLMNKRNSQFDFVFKEKNKASQWFILCRNDVELLANAPKKIINFTPSGAPDETFFIQTLNKLGSKIIQGSSHYVKWPNWVTKHPVVFNSLLSEDVNNSYFIRKTFPTFVPKIITPSRNCFLVCIGTESIQNYEHLINGDIYILSMINSSLVTNDIKNRCVQFYYVVHKFVNVAITTLQKKLKKIYKNVILIEEKEYKENVINNYKISYKNRFDVIDFGFNVTKIKIAFLFLIIDDINHPSIWTDYFNNNWNNVMIYCHPKNPENVKTPWLKNRIINNLVSTGWGYIVEAYLELLKQAYNDGATHFITISESCLPIYSYNKLHTFISNNDSKISYINVKRIGSYDLNVRLKNHPTTIKIKKHDARFCLSRYHAYRLLNYRELKYFIETQVGDEFFLSVLDLSKYVKVMAITYDNWEDIDKEVVRLKQIVKSLTAELPYSNKQDEIIFDINQINKHIDNIRKNPLTYTEITNAYIQRAKNSGSFFWRKFPKSLDASEFYTNKGALIYR
jgi:hypothetical protein